MATEWKRHEFGYLRSDGEWFLERGARMSHGSHAWLIWHRVTGDRIGNEDGVVFDTKTSLVLRTTTELTGTQFSEEQYFSHEYDAGWLFEAKHVVVQVEAEEVAS